MEHGTSTMQGTHTVGGQNQHDIYLQRTARIEQCASSATQQVSLDLPCQDTLKTNYTLNRSEAHENGGQPTFQACKGKNDLVCSIPRSHPETQRSRQLAIEPAPTHTISPMLLLTAPPRAFVLRPTPALATCCGPCATSRHGTRSCRGLVGTLTGPQAPVPIPAQRHKNA
jgi:hypothetical protein